MNNRFASLKISEWQQFKNIDIEFHDRLTILTGANGSGKTTILNLLARHHDWQVQSCAVPVKSKKSSAFRFLTRLFRGHDRSSENEIGQIVYEDGQIAKLTIPNPA